MGQLAKLKTYHAHENYHSYGYIDFHSNICLFSLFWIIDQGHICDEHCVDDCEEYEMQPKS